MKNKLRKIIVDDIQFLWTIGYAEGKFGWQNSKITDDSIILKIWIEGYKKTPWVNVKYKFHDKWQYYGDIIAISKSEDPEVKKRAEAYFNFKPLTPKNVSEIIEQAMSFFSDKYGDKIYNENANENFDYIDGKLFYIE